MKKPKIKQKSHAQSRPAKSLNPKLPFIEHLYELRRRLFYITLSIGLWATGAYFVQQKIVAILLKPADNQQFIYTSVGGGIDFLFRVCIYTGVIFSIPVIVFQVLKYLEPLIKRDAVRFMTLGSMASGALAIAGMIFGYFVGLPAALHFLLHQFTTDQIHPLLTIQSYMSFVTLYMLGSALLFQLPLLLVFINRVKPLKPKKLLGMERWVILVAFILGGIVNPSPRVQDQVLLAGPIIITYQIGVLIIWLSNRRGKRPARIVNLRQHDEEARAARLAQFHDAQEVLRQKRAATTPASATLTAQPSPAPIAAVIPALVVPTPLAPAPTAQNNSTPVRSMVRRGNYFNDFTPHRRPVVPMRAPREDQLSTET